MTFMDAFKAGRGALIQQGLRAVAETCLAGLCCIVVLVPACGGRVVRGSVEDAGKNGGADAPAGGSGGEASSGASRDGGAGTDGGNGCEPLEGCSSATSCPAPDGCNACTCDNAQWVCGGFGCAKDGGVILREGGDCPVVPPQSGSPCTSFGGGCGYVGVGGGCPPDCFCRDSTWTCVTSTCPPFAACPIAAPTNGTPCDDINEMCSYPSADDSGGGSRCGCFPDGEWMCSSQ
jgi:hypothetical protein